MNGRIKKKKINQFKCFEFDDGEGMIVIARNKNECINLVKESMELFCDEKNVKVKLIPQKLYRKIKTMYYSKENSLGIACKEQYISAYTYCKIATEPFVF